VELIDEQAPDTEKIVLEGAGHMVNMEQPEEFNRAVLDFLPR
jgi:pimeloyl-ACP methyl ester carboxylesterase